MSTSLTSLTSLTLQPFADLIRHGKHARTAQSADHPPADGHATNARDQRHDQQPPDRREWERAVEREREHHDHAKDKTQNKEMAEAIVKEEKAAKERMPYIRGLERFKLLAKMGECVPSPSPVSTHPHPSTAVHSHMYTKPSIHKPARKSPVSRIVLRHTSSVTNPNPRFRIVKVVRKYELSASQVGLLHHCLLPRPPSSVGYYSHSFSFLFFPVSPLLRLPAVDSMRPFVPHTHLHRFLRCRKGISISTPS